MWNKSNKPWIIQNEEFTSKKVLMARLRGIAEKYRWATAGFKALEDSDQEFVLAFFSQHSSIEEKIGGGVKRVLVASAREQDKNAYHNWCYYFETNGREKPIDVGANSCFETGTKIDDFREACYTVVSPRATAVLNRDFGDKAQIQCPETGEIITKSNCYVSYCDPSMREIIQKFIIVNNVNIESVEIAGETKREFVDETLADRFFHHHGMLARMRVVGRTAFYKRLHTRCEFVPLARDSVGI